MSALPITPPATGAASGTPRPRLRLVVTAGPGPAEDATPHPDADVAGDVLDPQDRGAPSAHRSLAPRTRAQALRRRVAALLVGGAIVGGLVAGGLQLAASTATDPAAAGLPMVPASAETVVVRPGQTVWSIASTHAPTGVSTADYAAMIVERNGLAGGDVDQWQVLRLPTP